MTESSKCPKCDNDVQGADLRRGSCPFCGYVDYSPYPEVKGKKKAEAAEEVSPASEEPK